MARTLPFQGGEAGSIPVDSTNYTAVVLWEGNGLSIRLRRVRFSSAVPVLLCSSKHGVCASLLMRNELGSIPRSTANLGAVVGYGFALQAYCLEGFDFPGLHQICLVIRVKKARIIRKARFNVSSILSVRVRSG